MARLRCCTCDKHGAAVRLDGAWYCVPCWEKRGRPCPLCKTPCDEKTARGCPLPDCPCKPMYEERP